MQRLKKIKSGRFSRGLALAKISVSAGARAATHAVGSLFVDEQGKAESFKKMLKGQMDVLAAELGELKGSLMKVGQLMSVYGEHFLPPEVNAVLKTLQNQSPPLEWEAIEKVIRRQLSPEQLSLIEIEQEPWASASLGQVHRARRRSDGQADDQGNEKLLAMKIQYPGVDQAIESDLATLRRVLSFSKLIPKGQNYDELFKEIRYMLHQEVDYSREMELTQDYFSRLKDDHRYIVPTVIPELSTRRILTTTFEEGEALDSPEVQGLSLERRNAIGRAFLELYFKEVFEFGAVQTDPHFGNYKIRLGRNGEPDRLVLLDFGAVRKFSRSFLESYRELVRGAHLRDPDRIIRGAQGVGFLREEDSEDLYKVFIELCYLITEPFCLRGMPGANEAFLDQNGYYHFGKSDLPKRVAKKASELLLTFRLRPPPREIVFLDRKLGGVFVFLAGLKTELRARDCIEPYL